MPAAPRIFISYRSSDGRDKATALARALGGHFGDAQVFLDKDDLPGGSAWRDEVVHTLGRRPVLLLLVTPGLLGDTELDADGHTLRRRIEQIDDPVRRELQAALDHGATVIPVLCDGVETPPDADALPPPFGRLADFTWRRLRAYDWTGDVQRLVADLERAGIARSPLQPAGAPARRGPRWAALAAGMLALAFAGWWLLAPRAAGPVDLSGTWQATLARGEAVDLALQQAGERITLASAPVSVAERPDWAAYRRFWREQTGQDLASVVYRGEGRVLREPGLPLRIDVAMQVLSGPGGGLIDSGNLLATANADGQRLEGRLWLNGEQGQWPASLQRMGPAR